MDVRMKVMDGVEATRRLRARDGAPPVLVLTTFDDDDVLSGALRAGAAGFVLKDAPGDTVDVGIGATELFAARLHVGMRVRGGASDLAVEASWSVGVAAVTRAIRDELIALAHGAAYVL